MYPSKNGDKVCVRWYSKKMVSALLAILLGSFGVHEFYLGNQKSAIIRLVISLVGFVVCGIPTIVMSIISIVEGVKYLMMTDEEFEQTYVVGSKDWF